MTLPNQPESSETRKNLDFIRTIIEDVKGRYKQARGEVNFGIFD